MARMTIELSQFKSAGVYTIEVDQSERITVSAQSLRLVPGFAASGPYNSPVFIRSTKDLSRFFGDNDIKLERKGSFFQRSIATCLLASPVFAINLLKVNDLDSSSNTDKVGFVALSLDSSNNTKQDVSTNSMYANFFNRERFWKADPEYLQGVVNNSANVPAGSFSAPFLSLANVSTKDISFIVKKAGNVSGYGVTALDWYGNVSNIPYSWIRPYDLISDFFIQVVAVEGNWSNYAGLSVDPYFSSYFNKSGIIPTQVNSFINSPQINLVGSWVGCIIPNFKDKTGSEQYIEPMVNSSTPLTGVLMNINQDAMDQLVWNSTTNQWVVGEGSAASYLVDLVGHGLANVASDASTFVNKKFMSYDISIAANMLHTDVSVNMLDTFGKTFTIDNSIAGNITIGTLVRAASSITPGVTRVISKTYGMDASTGYTIKTSEPVYGSGSIGALSVRLQKPLDDASVCSAYKMISLKGLNITNKHVPGFDVNGSPSAEEGVKKVYGMLLEPGILRGLTNPDMIQYRYIVDTMGYGLQPELGGKSYLSSLAKKRGKCTAIISAPSIKQFATAANPYFCDTFIAGVNPVPIFSTEWIATGGNPDMPRSFQFTLPTEENGAKYCGVFGPFLTYNDKGKTIAVPPAADVSNTYIRKFLGGDPYAIVANQNGILSNANITGVEYSLDRQDRDSLEPFGYNSIIQKPGSGQIMIYANSTAYQSVKSDYNNLHVRELLNTVELQIDSILQQYVFSYNNPLTRLNIINSVSPIFESMKDAGAIYKYEIIMDETNNASDVILDGFGIIDFGLWITGALTKIIARYTVNSNTGLSSGGFATN